MQDSGVKGFDADDIKKAPDIKYEEPDDFDDGFNLTVDPLKQLDNPGSPGEPKEMDNPGNPGKPKEPEVKPTKPKESDIGSPSKPNQDVGGPSKPNDNLGNPPKPDGNYAPPDKDYMPKPK